jgi:hypothetical protein
MSLLGFDALGRLALGQNTFVSSTPATLSQFLSFDQGIHAPNRAKDWIAFAQNLRVQTTPQLFDFTQFSPGQHAPNRAVPWIAYSGNEFIEAFPQIGIDFLTFSPGRTAKFWGTGQTPQWWTYYLNTQFFPKRDTHDGGHLRRHRHPPVYEQSYYDELNRKRQKPRPDDEPESIPKIYVPNYLIPIKGIIPPALLPSLLLAPPPWPMPTLTNNPPDFRMATPEEIDDEDEFIIRMLLLGE